MSGMIGTSQSRSRIVGRSLDTAKAWINFDGDSLGAARNSYNVRSIADGGAGKYTVNFIAAMPNINYTSVGMAGESNTSLRTVMQNSAQTPPTVGGCHFQTCDADGSVTDPDYVGIAIFGD
jgi:hypothetical protein